LSGNSSAAVFSSYMVNLQVLSLVVRSPCLPACPAHDCACNYVIVEAKVFLFSLFILLK